MATSGTTSFIVTRDDIINAALRLIKAIPERNRAVGALLNNSTQALNIMVKSWVTEGLPLWAVQDIAIPMVANQKDYNVGPLTVPTAVSRPVRILDAYLRTNATAQDVSVMLVARTDYDLLGAKSQPGIPNQVFYDPQLGNGILSVYPVPTDTSATLHIVMQRPFQDFNAATDNPDFTQECYQALKWSLAEELFPEYGNIADQNMHNLIIQKAKIFRDGMGAFWQDSTSTFFTPTERKF